MDNTKNNKRRDFLMNVCPTVAMAFLGITVLDSCSSGDDDSDYGTGSNNNSGNGNGNNSTDQGYTVSGNSIAINGSLPLARLQNNSTFNCAQILDIISCGVFMCVMGCMTGQVFEELDYLRGDPDKSAQSPLMTEKEENLTGTEPPTVAVV